MGRAWVNRGALAAAALLLCGCQAELYSNLTEREANEIMAVLLDAGVAASKQTGREGLVTVSVDEGAFARSMALLEARGLPSARYQSLGDVFQKEGFVSSPVEERARFIYALGQELSRTISEIDGVLSARVHIVLPESDMLGRDFKPSSASVFIRHAPDANVQKFAAQIKLLVANSIEGLVYDKVTVVTVPAAKTSFAAAGAGAATASPAFKSVAGVLVHPGSVQRLWTLLGVSLGVSALALIGLVVGMAQSRSRERKPAVIDRADAA